MNQESEKYIGELKSFLSFPSISSDSTKKESVRACAVWLCNHLKKIGLQTTELHATPLHPVVYAEHISHPSYKTILFYGHYDVQPASPIGQWKIPPFQPLVKNGFIYGRGASDDKGQLFIHIKAIESLLKKSTHLPVNIKCLYEGEEEIGSPHLEQFIRYHKARLGCDVAVVSDTKMLSTNQPAITYSLRGSLNAELIIRRSGKELHSGTFGGIVQNPADVIAKVVSHLYDAYGKVAIPGFYRNVAAVDHGERTYMRQNGPSDIELLQDGGTGTAWGEKGFSAYERTTIRPSLVVSSITCGYQGEGVKNVIPSQAAVKMNLRLVPNQEPQLIAKSLAGFIRSKLPENWFHHLKFSSMSRPVEVSRSHPFVLAAAGAYQKAFASAPRFLRAGGTIPVVGMFKEILNVPTVLMGFALATDDMHAPNEKFYLPNFFKGITVVQQFITNMSKLTRLAYDHHSITI